uniref:Uncharacterized protein n=1 Tax=Mycena chlorophos TaxID=658473 RepID=A0ABQ0L705_MYCCL|nr:predicted protein [Mycena chlorophos]
MDLDEFREWRGLGRHKLLAIVKANSGSLEVVEKMLQFVISGGVKHWKPAYVQTLYGAAETAYIQHFMRLHYEREEPPQSSVPVGTVHEEYKVFCAQTGVNNPRSQPQQFGGAAARAFPGISKILHGEFVGIHKKGEAINADPRVAAALKKKAEKESGHGTPPKGKPKTRRGRANGNAAVDSDEAEARVTHWEPQSADFETPTAGPSSFTAPTLVSTRSACPVETHLRHRKQGNDSTHLHLSDLLQTPLANIALSPLLRVRGVLDEFSLPHNPLFGGWDDSEAPGYTVMSRIQPIQNFYGGPGH